MGRKKFQLKSIPFSWYGNLNWLRARCPRNVIYLRALVSNNQIINFTSVNEFIYRPWISSSDRGGAALNQICPLNYSSHYFRCPCTVVPQKSRAFPITISICNYTHPVPQWCLTSRMSSYCLVVLGRGMQKGLYRISILLNGLNVR